MLPEKSTDQALTHSEAIRIITTLIESLSDFAEVELTVKGDQSPRAFRDQWKEVTIRLNSATYTFRPKP